MSDHIMLISLPGPSFRKSFLIRYLEHLGSRSCRLRHWPNFAAVGLTRLVVDGLVQAPAQCCRRHIKRCRFAFAASDQARELDAHGTPAPLISYLTS
jgi:hypothetical protein